MPPRFFYDALLNMVFIGSKKDGFLSGKKAQ